MLICIDYQSLKREHKRSVMPLIAFSTGRRRMEPRSLYKYASRLISANALLW